MVVAVRVAVGFIAVLVLLAIVDEYVVRISALRFRSIVQTCRRDSSGRRSRRLNVVTAVVVNGSLGVRMRCWCAAGRARLREGVGGRRPRTVPLDLWVLRGGTAFVVGQVAVREDRLGRAWIRVGSRL